MSRRVGDDRAQGERGTRFIAAVAGQVHAPRLVVDMGDPKDLDTRVDVGEATGEEAPGGLHPVEFNR